MLIIVGTVVYFGLIRSNSTDPSVVIAAAGDIAFNNGTVQPPSDARAIVS
jgi:hypothetical protein